MFAPIADKRAVSAVQQQYQIIVVSLAGTRQWRDNGKFIVPRV